MRAAATSDDTRWATLTAIRHHRYDYQNKGAKVGDPGWHGCSCREWEGYWIDFEHHVADQVMAALAAALSVDQTPKETT